MLLTNKNLFPVVGIAAASGGLEAFSKFIRAIPPDTDMVYILLQHLQLPHSSSLPLLLQRETQVKVYEMNDRVTITPGNIYVVPSDKLLVAGNGQLQLDERLT